MEAEPGGHVTEEFLSLTLEVIYLLTGERCALIKMAAMESLVHGMYPPMRVGRRTRPSPTLQTANQERILEVTKKMTQLLTREVPMRCQDVVVYLSTEDREYLEEHKDLYQPAMREDSGRPPSPDCQYRRSNTEQTSDHCQGEPEDITADLTPHGDLILINPAGGIPAVPDPSTPSNHSPISPDITRRPSKTEPENLTADPTGGLPVTPNVSLQLPSPDPCSDSAMYGDQITGLSTPSNHSLPISPDIAQRICKAEREDLTSDLSGGILVTPNVSMQLPGPDLCSDFAIYRDNVTAIPDPSTSRYPILPISPGVTLRICKAEHEDLTPDPSEGFPGTPNRSLQLSSLDPCSDPAIYGDQIPDVPDPSAPSNHFPPTSPGIIQRLLKTEPEDLTEGYSGGIPVIANVQLPGEDMYSDPATWVEQNLVNPSGSVPDPSTTYHSPPSKPFLCSHCGKSFLYRSRLLSHIKTHLMVKPFSCSECGKCFYNQWHLSRHRDSHTGEKPYQCSECGKCFTQKSYLKIHKTLHTGVKPYSCSDCGKCFYNKPRLSMHRRIHTGEKPYSCPQCGKCFSLGSHLNVHRRENPYSCAECKLCFSQESELTQHQELHAPNSKIRPICSLCGKTFSRNSSLIRHRRIHTGERPYTCFYCGESFSQNSHLLRHQKLHSEAEP